MRSSCVGALPADGHSSAVAQRVDSMSVGYIFFGSAIAISDKLVAAARAMLAEDAATMTGKHA